MQRYGIIPPSFWTGPLGRRIRAEGVNVQLLAAYVGTSPHSNMLGIYYLPQLFIGHETAIPPKAIPGAFDALAALDYAHYDAEQETVFVREMVSWQMGETLAPGDKRRTALERLLLATPHPRFVQMFLDRYAAFGLKVHGCPTEGASVPHRSPTVTAPDPDPDPQSPGDGTPQTQAAPAAPPPVPASDVHPPPAQANPIPAAPPAKPPTAESAARAAARATVDEILTLWSERTGHKIISPTVRQKYVRMLLARLVTDKIPPAALKLALAGALVDPYYVEKGLTMPENIWRSGERVQKLMNSWKEHGQPGTKLAARVVQDKPRLTEAEKEKARKVAASGLKLIEKAMADAAIPDVPGAPGAEPKGAN